MNQSLRVEKTISMKGLDGRTTSHRVSEGTMVWEILDDWMTGLDVMISFNGKVVGMHDTVGGIGIGHDCTLRCSMRMRGGAQRFRQPQPDIPGQWTCGCVRCEIVASGVGVRGAMIRLHLQLLPMLLVTGRPLQRSNPVNPTYQPNQTPPQPVAPTALVQNFPPMKQPLPVGHVDAFASGFCSRVPSGKFRLAQEVLAAGLEPQRTI